MIKVFSYVIWSFQQLHVLKEAILLTDFVEEIISVIKTSILRNGKAVVCLCRNFSLFTELTIRRCSEKELF